ncbi:hypothetical protein ACFXJ5_09325 [Streptomyces sp. NPDC059373]
MLLASGPAATASATAVIAALNHQPLTSATRALLAQDLHLASAAVAAFWLIKLVLTRQDAATSTLGLACATAGACLITHLLSTVPSTSGLLMSAGRDALFAGVLVWITKERLNPHCGTFSTGEQPVAGREGFHA